MLLAHQGGELYGSDKMFALAVRALAADYDVDVILGGDGPLRPRLDEYATSVRIAALGVLRRSAVATPCSTIRWLIENARVAVRLLVELARQRPAIVVTNTSVVWAPALVAFILRVPHVWYVHEALEPSSRGQRIAMSLQLRLSRLVVTCSSPVAEVYRNTWPEHAQMIRVVPNALEIEWEEMLVGLPAPPVGAGKTVLVVGRLSERKGQREAILALRAVRDAGVPADLVLVGEEFGDKEFKSQLRALAKRVGVEPYVRFAGYCSDPYQEYELANVVLVPSVQPEAFGLVALEGMMAGRPVVASACGGLREIVVDGLTGLLVPPADVDALGRAVVRVLADDAAALQMGAEGRRRAVSEFSEAKYGLRLRAAVGSVIGW